MRELRPNAIRSARRERWRAFYASYISSAEWFRRRERWEREEQARTGNATISCFGGCGARWRIRQDDLHHCSYDRLGEEAREDLWPMCRPCHDRLHELMESTRTWRRLPRRLANDRALTIMTAEGVRINAPTTLRDYL